ncbi:VOC family protein [Demequina sp. NBRC 110053]|uniref:VOC family protein n=1 Tax=Demequina sp. NBRC 110053 TaxID=1570342 RepID=UPI0009FC902B|nr:VOC family protein [Demequina sp. NBRC 110053]
MLASSPAFGSWSTDSVAKAAAFYGDVLGIDTRVDEAMGPMLTLSFPNGARFLVYEKDDHQPATHTVLMLPVEDVTATARSLAEAGVTLEQLEWTDDDGVARDPDGQMPETAWFKDPAGNWISILSSNM